MSPGGNGGPGQHQLGTSLGRHRATPRLGDDESRPAPPSAIKVRRAVPWQQQRVRERRPRAAVAAAAKKAGGRLRSARRGTLGRRAPRRSPPPLRRESQDSGQPSRAARARTPTDKYAPHAARASEDLMSSWRK